MANVLGPGDVRVGHIDDGLADLHPVQAATLTFDEKRGAQLHIAYLNEYGHPEPHQFRKTVEWFKFSEEKLPATLVFVDDKGFVTLNETHVSGQSMGARPIGRVRARVTIFNRPRLIKEEYRVREFLSTIDGLEDFSRFQPVNNSVEQLEGGRNRVTVVIETSESVQWEARGFTYAIKSEVAWSAQDGRNFHVLDSAPILQTTSAAGASAQEHLSAQWPIRALLILVHGKKLAWRSHKLRDDQFPTWLINGRAIGPHAVDVQLAGTVEQQRSPEPAVNSLALPMIHLADLGADGMRKWVELYGNETFRRAVQPAVEVINGAARFLEPQLMMLAMSLDRFGYFRFGDKKRRPMFANIQKCLEGADIDWSATIGSRVGIAKAIANVNNDLKHPDREAYPETDALAGMVRLAEIIVRAQVFDLVGVDVGLRQEFLDHNDALNAMQIFIDNGISVDDNGLFRRASEHTVDIV